MLNNVLIEQALSQSGERAVLTLGSFFLRPTTDGNTIICGVAEQALLGNSTLDQIWCYGAAVLFPFRKYLDRNGYFAGMPLSAMLASHLDLDTTLVKTYQADERALQGPVDVGGDFLHDGSIQQWIDGQEKIGTTAAFLIRPSTQANRTIVCGYVRDDFVADTPVGEKERDQVWQGRLLLCPAMRLEDRTGELAGYLPQQVLCSNVSPSKFHRLD
ncbi:MAG: hypothetical protein K2W82_16065 [Candidatus Obscuribacterales bacterium]|nr:hypothetical protein [Candidatus Obscuribacterales bacterium]